MWLQECERKIKIKTEIKAIRCIARIQCYREQAIHLEGWQVLVSILSRQGEPLMLTVARPQSWVGLQYGPTQQPQSAFIFLHITLLLTAMLHTWVQCLHQLVHPTFC